MESNDLIGYVIVGAVVIVLICFQLEYFCQLEIDKRGTESVSGFKTVVCLTNLNGNEGR